ncbi:one cut domain family member 2-like [Fagus crenata]
MPGRVNGIHHRSISPIHNQVLKSKTCGPIPAPKKMCTCSPTLHLGSFRCNLHKNSSHGSGSHDAAPYPSNRLNMLRFAMTRIFWS